jgi:hypothetical protein
MFSQYKDLSIESGYIEGPISQKFFQHYHVKPKPKPMKVEY